MKHTSLHVFYTVSPTSDPVARHLAELPTAQRERAVSMAPKRQAEFVLGRWLLLQMASKSKQDIVIQEREDLPPRVLLDSSITHCSLSHCRVDEKLVAAAVFAQHPIGIDIEGVRKGWTKDKAALFCTLDELEQGLKIDNQQKCDRYFTQCWCRKEALSKFHQRSVWSAETLVTNLNHDMQLQDFEISDVGTATQTLIGTVYGVSLAQPIQLARIS